MFVYVKVKPKNINNYSVFATMYHQRLLVNYCTHRAIIVKSRHYL